MNHPAKNKKKTIAAVEETIDERNLIDLEEAVELSVEEKINLFWMQNKQSIVRLLILGIVAIIGFNGAKIYQGYKVEQLQASYSEAKANGTLAEFADTYSQHKLGAFAALSLADQAYQDKDFSLATDYYTAAALGLKDHLLEGRARLGEAFSQYYQGDQAKGLSLLRSLTADSALAESARAEAAYHLAVEADLSGDTDAFDNYQSQIQSLELAGQWQQRLAYYQRQSAP
jgi:predicted negative regulator of RcsB-dependent stress response